VLGLASLMCHAHDGGHGWDSQRHVKRDVRPLPQRVPPCTGTGASWWICTINCRYGFGINRDLDASHESRSMIRIRWSTHMGRSGWQDRQSSYSIQPFSYKHIHALFGQTVCGKTVSLFFSGTIQDRLNRKNKGPSIHCSETAPTLSSHLLTPRPIFADGAGVRDCACARPAPAPRQGQRDDEGPAGGSSSAHSTGGAAE
jgi:hypothetical protein